MSLSVGLFLLLAMSPAISAAQPVSDAERDFWAFRPLMQAAVPTVVDVARVRTPVDAFVLARLEAAGIDYALEADRVTLLRRTHLDLIGLPPSPEDVDAFLADMSVGAFERVVDRLLASPHFGERWGRHWLDVAGYVDTVGFDTDATNVITSDGKWLYRDYVIRSINEDKPYDCFVTEQLAGDELYDWRRAEQFTPQIREALIATGYLRTARDYTHEDVGVIPQNFYGILHDTLEIVGTGLLGLTVHCARCHDHKFDPLPQEDYYRLMACFSPAYNPLDWRAVLPFGEGVQDRSLPDISPAEQAAIEAYNKAIDDRVAETERRLADLRRPYETRLLNERLAAIPEPIRADTQAAVNAPADERTEVQRYLVDKFGGSLQVKPVEVAAALSDADRATVATLEAEIAQEQSRRRGWGKIQTLWDLGPPPPTHLLVRGEYEDPGPAVPPGYLRVLCGSEAESLAEVSPPAEGTSGRRTALARWLTRSDSPASALLARVMVNRLWQRLFGTGIVATPENFGAQGDSPTHAELLDWLSRRFIAEGWRIKPVLRLIVTSSAYRQSSHRPESTIGGDDVRDIEMNDALLWRMPLKRLESEIVRDSILAVSGCINRAQGGPPILTEAQPDGAVVVAASKLLDPSDAFRRSVYLLSRRAYNLSLLTVFDQPQVATNCLGRDASAVPPQSLTMLNDEFLAEQSGYFAERVEQTSGPSAGERIAAAFRLAVARSPDDAEAASCRDYLERQQAAFQSAGQDPPAAEHHALAQLCLTLFNTSEFLYAE